MIIIAPNEKICSDCGCIKTLDKFHGGKRGLTDKCEKCHTTSISASTRRAMIHHGAICNSLKYDLRKLIPVRNKGV